MVHHEARNLTSLSSSKYMGAASFPTVTTESIRRLKGAFREPRGLSNICDQDTLCDKDESLFPYIYFSHEDPWRRDEESSAQIYWEARWKEKQEPHMMTLPKH